MENVRVGDIVRCINDKRASDSLIKNKHYEVVGVGSMLRIRDDNNEPTWYDKKRFIVIGGVSRQEIWHDGSGRSSNHFKIEIPTIHDINIPKLAQRLYEGVQKDMKVMSIKQLHKDIKNIYFNEDKRTTVIVFKNGDKVKATASKDTPYSEYAGFVTALFKYEKGLKLKDVEHLIKKKRG